MAATTNMSKVKKGKRPVSKDDLRRLMKEQNKSLKSGSKRIESPLAKYNSIGQLTCIVCTTQIKSDLLWNAHIQGRTHKENIVTVKAQNEAKKIASVAPPPGILRRALPEDNSTPSAKHVKLHGKGGVSKQIARDSCNKDQSPQKLRLGIGDYDSSEGEDSGGEGMATTAVAPPPCPTPNSAAAQGLPADFFDNGVIPSAPKPAAKEEIVTPTMADKLPEGFFDDPKQDAKVRQVEYRDKMEDEWEQFQRAMKQETIKSEAIQEEDDEAIITERNIEEIDDQLHRWTKVDSLAKIKEKLMVSEVQKTERADPVEELLEDIGSDDDDDQLDWRMT